MMQSLDVNLPTSPSFHRFNPHGSRNRRASLSLGTLRPVRCVLQSPTPVADEAEFVEASRKGNLVPLHKCIFADHLTPVLAYRCLVKEDDREAPSFLFESVEPGFRKLPF
ncbi:hypothetical protein R6Q57_019569 [Mikania cordata]